LRSNKVNFNSLLINNRTSSKKSVTTNFLKENSYHIYTTRLSSVIFWHLAVTLFQINAVTIIGVINPKATDERFHCFFLVWRHEYGKIGAIMKLEVRPIFNYRSHNWTLIIGYNWEENTFCGKKINLEFFVLKSKNNNIMLSFIEITTTFWAIISFQPLKDFLRWIDKSEHN